MLRGSSSRRLAARTSSVAAAAATPSATQVASTDASPGDAGDFETHKQQAKAIVKRLNSRSPSRMSIEAGSLSFNYLIEDGIIYLAMADKGYPKKLAFSYLMDVQRHFADDLSKEFGESWRSQVATVGRVYSFLRFDRQLQRLKREYTDPTTKANSSRLADDLNDIQNIMKKNIQEVLDRGEKLENVSKISNRLVSESKRFKWGAKRLNVLDAWRRWFPCIIAALIIAAVLLWYFMFSR